MRLTKLIIWLAALVVLLMVVSLIASGLDQSQAVQSNSQPTQIQNGVRTPPPLTAAIAEQLQQSHGFQMFVSYTDRGFEPTSATIKAGQGVRFTNNSSHELWIAAIPSVSGAVYPGSSDCGGSIFDTCKALNPGDFWEFTFSHSGTWAYQNNLDKSDTATIRVQ